MIEDAEDAINVTNYYTKVPQEPVGPRTPIFRNIAISHVTVNRCGVAVNIEGLPEMPIDGLRLTDVIASAKSGLRAYDTVGLELHDVQINPEDGPAFLIKDSKDLEMSGVACRRPNAAPVIRLDNCPGAIIRGSKEWPGTKTFVSVAPGQKTINLQGNHKIEESDTDYWKTTKKRK